MRVFDARQVNVRIENAFSGRGAGDDAPRGVTDEGLAGKGQALLLTHTVAQRGEVPVLEGGDAHLRLEETFRPLPHRTGLWGHDELSSVQGKRSHVLRIVAVVADRHTDPAGPCRPACNNLVRGSRRSP